MREYKQLGAYGLIIKEEKIVLIKKVGGPYDKKLDLPGGTIEFGERPEETLKRELLEEVGIKVLDWELFDADSVYFEWNYKDDVLVKVHHMGIFFKIKSFENEIINEIKIDKVNNDSIGADWYQISKLSRNELSNTAILELEKLGYVIN